MKQFAYRCIFACSARQGSGSAGGYSHGSLQEEKTFFFQVKCSLTLQGRLAVDLKLWPVFLIPLQLLSWIETSCWCITICKCLKQLLLVFLATCTVEGKKKKKKRHFHSDIKNCWIPDLAYTSYCLHGSLQQVFTKKKKSCRDKLSP